MKKIINKIKSINFLVFHLLDIGKINGNLIFSVFNIYFHPQSAPWVLFGIGIESWSTKVSKTEYCVERFIIITLFGKQKRIALKKRFEQC